MANHREPHEDGEDYSEIYIPKQICSSDIIYGRLKSLISKIDIHTNWTLYDNISTLAAELEKDFTLYSRGIINAVSECVIEFPLKSLVYSTLVGILNIKSFEFGGELVKHMEFMFNDALKACKWEEARYRLRFIANLVNCNVVSVNSFCDLLNIMVNEGILFDGPQNRQEWFIYCVLTTLPWVGKKLFDELLKDFEHLIWLIEIFISEIPNNRHHILQVWTENTAYPQEDSLKCLWSQICNLRDEHWYEDCIVRPYLNAEFILNTRNSSRHNLSLTILSPHNNTCQYPLPSVVFRMFVETDSFVQYLMPDAHSIERFIIEDDIHSVLNSFKSDRKNCITALLNLSYRKEFQLKYSIIEVIFGKLFHLPTSQLSEKACGSLLIELCKSNPQMIAQLLAETADLLITRIDTMKVACVYRFVNWFSYHLSYFRYNWDWKNWKDYLTLDEEHPKIRFIKEVIVKCLGLAYHKKDLKSFSEQLPESFARFIPLQPKENYKYYKDEAASSPEISLVRLLLTESIRQGTSTDEILKILNIIQNSRFGNEYKLLQIEVFMQMLLKFLSSKSFFHSKRVLEKFCKVLKALSESEEAQICILHNMFVLRRYNRQMIIVLVNKLLQIEVLEYMSIVKWIFSNKMRPELTKMYIWEIFNCTIRTMSMNNCDIGTNMFLSFKKFTKILSDHLVKCDLQKHDYNTHCRWCKTIVGYLEQVLLEHHVLMQKLFNSEFDTFVFTPNLNSRILDVIKRFKSVNN